MKYGNEHEGQGQSSLKSKDKVDTDGQMHASAVSNYAQQLVSLVRVTLMTFFTANYLSYYWKKKTTK